MRPALIGAAASGVAAWSWSALAHQPELHLAPASLGSAPLSSWPNTGSATTTIASAGSARPDKKSINSVDCADLDGVDDILSDDVHTMSGVISVSAWHFFCVMKISSVSHDDATLAYNNEGLFGDHDGIWGITLRSTGPNVQVRQQVVTTGHIFVEDTFSLNVATLIEAKLSSGVLSLRVGSAAPVTLASTNLVGVPAGPWGIGKAFVTRFMTGDIAEPVLSKVVYSGDDLTNIRTYYADTYGVTA